MKNARERSLSYWSSHPAPRRDREGGAIRGAEHDRMRAGRDLKRPGRWHRDAVIAPELDDAGLRERQEDTPR